MGRDVDRLGRAKRVPVVAKIPTLQLHDPTKEEQHIDIEREAGRQAKASRQKERRASSSHTLLFCITMAAAPPWRESEPLKGDTKDQLNCIALSHEPTS